MNPDKIKRFNVPLSVIKDGLHDFEFDLDNRFFEELESDEEYRGELHAGLQVDKQERMFIFGFHITGYIWVTCDRCLDDFRFEVDVNERLIIKYGAEYREEDDEVIVVPENQHYFNVARYLYEYTVLSLPIRKVHPDDENGISGCNPQALEKLNALQEKKEIDPRWEQLKNLFNQNNNKKV